MSRETKAGALLELAREHRGGDTRRQPRMHCSPVSGSISGDDAHRSRGSLVRTEHKTSPPGEIPLIGRTLP